MEPLDLNALEVPDGNEPDNALVSPTGALRTPVYGVGGKHALSHECFVLAHRVLANGYVSAHGSGGRTLAPVVDIARVF